MTTPREPFGSAYDPAYVGNNFAELKKYQYVMHKRGRAVYWVDQNERDWINSGFRRRIMQNIIGDAAVEDAFLCVGTGANNNFDITGGDSAPGVPKHFYLGGYPVIVELDTTFNDHRTDLNEDLGDAVPFLTTPSGSDRTDEIYLDIYFIDVKDDVDAFIRPDNALAGITNRWRLISEIKVAENGVTPASPFVDGTGREHHTVKLATLERFDGQAAINPADVTDVRRTFTYGTIANGGLALTDPGGFQAAIDFTSGGVPSMDRHAILGTDTVQSQLDQAGAGNQMFVGSNGMQDAFDNVVGVPSAGNPVVLVSDIPVPTAASTSFDNSGTSLSATDVQGAVEELDARGIGFAASGIVFETGGNIVTIDAGANVLSTDGLFTLANGGIVTINITASGVNGLDTGAEAADTWYAVLLIGDSNNVNPIAGLLVAEANFPGSITFPAGYDKAGLLGWTRNGSASSLLAGLQVDDMWRYYDEHVVSTGFSSGPFAPINTSTVTAPGSRLVDARFSMQEDGQSLTRTAFYAEAGRSGSVGGVQILRMHTGQEVFDGSAALNSANGIPIDKSATRVFALRVSGTVDTVAITGYVTRLVA